MSFSYNKNFVESSGLNVKKIYLHHKQILKFQQKEHKKSRNIQDRCRNSFQERCLLAYFQKNKISLIMRKRFIFMTGS